MSAIDVSEALEGALGTGRVRRKANKTGNLKSRAARVTKDAPEVMVKITGFKSGAAQVKAHLQYISRNGEVELENDRGELLKGRDAVNELFKDWSQSFSDSPRHKSQRDAVSVVLSMPEDTPPEAVREAARAFAKQNFGGNHEYVFALHIDEPHPHVHLTVKIRGFDGRSLNPRKADLQEWRDSFAEAMRDQGVDAESTPRTSRGVTRKPEPNVVRHMERGEDREDRKPRAPRVPEVRALQVRAVTNEIDEDQRRQVQGGAAPAPKPWEKAIQKNLEAKRSAWLQVAAALETGPQFKENPNARPDYERLDVDRARAGQRAAAVYQSSLESTGQKAQAAAIARMRNVSSVAVVQHERSAQVLLHADAPDHVGGHGGTHTDLRRPRTRHLGAGSSPGGSGGAVEAIGGPRVPEGADRALAARIRGMVGATLPALPEKSEQEREPRVLDTAATLLKRKLLARHTTPATDGAKGIDVQPPAPGRDLDR